MTTRRRPPCLVLNHTYDFLPQDYDFVLITTNKVDGMFADERVEALGVRAQDLAGVSSVFESIVGMADASAKQDMWVDAGCSCAVLALLLSAALEQDKDCLAQCAEWENLLEAIDLARKWRLEHARTHLFTAMVGLLPDPHEGPFKPFAPFLCEANVQGEAAVVLVSNVLKLRKRAALPAIDVGTVSLSQHYVLELGAQGISKVMEDLVELTRDGLLT